MLSGRWGQILMGFTFDVLFYKDKENMWSFDSGTNDWHSSLQILRWMSYDKLLFRFNTAAVFSNEYIELFNTNTLWGVLTY